MSTEEIILALEAAETLARVRPRLHGLERDVRRMSLLKQSIHDWAIRGGKNQDLKAAARAHFGQFVKGEAVDDREFMKRVSRRQADGTDDFSDQIWSLRPAAEPKHRFFGAFACANWFLVFNMQSRDYLEKNSNHWHTEMDKAIRTWDSLFPGRRRWFGTRFSHYVQFNSEHADERWEEEGDEDC